MLARETNLRHRIAHNRAGRREGDVWGRKCSAFPAHTVVEVSYGVSRERSAGLFNFSKSRRNRWIHALAILRASCYTWQKMRIEIAYAKLLGWKLAIAEASGMEKKNVFSSIFVRHEILGVSIRKTKTRVSILKRGSREYEKVKSKTNGETASCL